GKNVAVRQFLDAIALGPQRPRGLDFADAVSLRIKMLPGSPFPDGLPKHLAVPVGFENYPAFERKPAEKALLRGAPVIKERSTLREIAGMSRRVGQAPAVDDLAVRI